MAEATLLDKTFATDVFKGLTAIQKYIPSKYFYDEAGDKLFQDIMHMPEYYLTRCEYEILSFNKEILLSCFTKGADAFRLIELGAGDGLKTKILLRHFSEKGICFDYLPVDISANALNKLLVTIKQQMPAVNSKGLEGDYFDCIDKLARNDGVKNVVLLLGSNIGNYSNEEALRFLKSLNKSLSKGDNVLIGFDLKKDPALILDAYNDKSGITKVFNLNLLNRINKELGADFNIENFKHYPVYDPETGECKSYLLSTKRQQVIIKQLNVAISFRAWEPIYTEVSKKYSIQEINELAEATGFKVRQNFLDCKHYFVDSLWEVNT